MNQETNVFDEGDVNADVDNSAQSGNRTDDTATSNESASNVPAEVKRGPPRYEDLADITVQEMLDVFTLFDYHGTGFISTDDLGTTLRGIGKNVTEKQICGYINLYDKDGIGKLDFAVFYKILSEGTHLPGPASETEVVNAFHYFDLLRNGKISVQDMVHMLREMGEPLTIEDVEALLREVEIDGDNNIDIGDFINHMYITSMP